MLELTKDDILVNGDPSGLFSLIKKEIIQVNRDPNNPNSTVPETALVFSANIVPAADQVWNLGNKDRKFKEMYISADTIYLGSNTKMAGTSMKIDGGPAPLTIDDKPEIQVSEITLKPFQKWKEDLNDGVLRYDSDNNPVPGPNSNPGKFSPDGVPHPASLGFTWKDDDGTTGTATISIIRSKPSTEFNFGLFAPGDGAGNLKCAVATMQKIITTGDIDLGGNLITHGSITLGDGGQIGNGDDEVQLNGNILITAGMGYAAQHGGTKAKITIDGGAEAGVSILASNGPILINAGVDGRVKFYSRNFKSGRITEGGVDNDWLIYDTTLTESTGQTPDYAKSYQFRPQGTTDFYFIETGMVRAVASSALYADLAEIYSIIEEDESYAVPGTVVMVNDTSEADVKICDEVRSSKCFGVVSERPAFIMNNSCEGVIVSLKGRTPVRVIGEIKKGQRIISAGNGLAKAVSNNDDLPFSFGIALETKTSHEEGYVECTII